MPQRDDTTQGPPLSDPLDPGRDPEMDQFLAAVVAVHRPPVPPGALPPQLALPARNMPDLPVGGRAVRPLGAAPRGGGRRWFALGGGVALAIALVALLVTIGKGGVPTAGPAGYPGTAIALPQTPSATVPAASAVDGGERTVPIVVPTITGAPAAGYQIGSVTPSPAQIALAGDTRTLQGIRNVAVAPITIDNPAQAITVVVPLALDALPAGVTVAGGATTVTVTIQIVPLTIDERSVVPIRVINRRPGLQYTAAPLEATVTLRGTRQDLDRLGAGFTAVADLGSIDVPTPHAQVPLMIQVPAASGVQIVKVDPAVVTIAVSPAP